MTSMYANLNQKEYEFEEYMQGAIPREEYALEFLIAKGQIERAMAQQIQAETGRVWI